MERLKGCRLKVFVVGVCLAVVGLMSFEDLSESAFSRLPTEFLPIVSSMLRTSGSAKASHGVIEERQVGIKGHGVLLSWIKDTGVDYLNVTLVAPNEICYESNIYRYFIVGPTQFAGYLRRQQSGFILSVRRRIEHAGRYRVQVFLEDGSCLRSLVGFDGEVKAKERENGAGLAGLVVTEPSSTLSIHTQHQPASKSQPRCSFLGDARIDFRADSLTSSTACKPEREGLKLTSFCLKADNCRLLVGKMPNVRAVFSRFASSKKIRVSVWGASGSESVAKKLREIFKISAPKIVSSIEFVRLGANTYDSFIAAVKKLQICAVDSQIELIYFSTEAWQIPTSRQGQSSADLLQRVEQGIRKVAFHIDDSCSDRRRYRLLWMSYPAYQSPESQKNETTHGMDLERPLRLLPLSGSLWDIYHQQSHRYRSAYVPLAEMRTTARGFDASSGFDCSTEEVCPCEVELLLQATVESLAEDTAEKLKSTLESLQFDRIKKWVQVGRDGFQVLLVWSAEQSVDYVNIVFLNPHEDCGVECLYRYYIVGPSTFGGFLQPFESKYLHVRRRVYEAGVYKVVVLLESLGRTKPSPLPLNMSSYANTSFLNASDGKIRLVGLIATDPDAELYIDSPFPLDVEAMKARPVCSFKGKSGRIDFRLVEKSARTCSLDSLEMSGHCLQAEQCRLTPPSFEDVESGISHVFSSTSMTARLLFIGTSRVEMLFRGMAKLLAKPPYRRTRVWRSRSLNETVISSISEIRFMETQPNVTFKLSREISRHNVCRDPTRFELIYFSIGIHETRQRLHDLIRKSPVQYAESLARKIQRVAQILRGACHKRAPYKIIWMSQPATHVFINYHELPRWNQRNDIVARNFFIQLQQSTHFLVETKRVYRNQSIMDNTSYIPFNEMTIALFHDGPMDHLHYWGMAENGAFSKVLLQATVELLS